VRHFIGSASRHDGSDLDGVVGFEQAISWNESPIADHEVSFARQFEFSE